MSHLQVWSDKCAIALSATCAIHCLGLPLLLLLMPSLASIGVGAEWFHHLMVVLVLPSSVVALRLGCRQHGMSRLWWLASAGISCLSLALVLPETLAQPELLEKSLTLLGSSLLAVCHFINYKQCQSHTDCQCNGASL